MNDQFTSQATSAPIVLKLKKCDDHHSDFTLPHTSHLSNESVDDELSMSPSSLSRTDESLCSITTSPSILRVKLKNPFRNGNTDLNDDESITSENFIRPAKRSKKSFSNDTDNDNASTNEFESSQQEKQSVDTHHESCITSEPLLTPPLVLKIRRDSLTMVATTTSHGSSPMVDTELNRQLLIKLKKNENGELTASKTSVDTEIPMEFKANETSSAMHSDSIHINGHIDSLDTPLSAESAVSVPEVFANGSSSQVSQSKASSASSDLMAESHTKELLDEALDSVKSVLMQTFKKNLESGGDLNALKSTLSSDEVAEAFLAKLRQSLKRDAENESKPRKTETGTENQTIPTPTTSTVISVTTNANAESSSSAPSPLPSTSSIVNESSSPSPLPQSQSTSSNNKKKAAMASTNPNRFEGTTEDELSKRLLSDILQPNLDIVFVGINPSLYAVHKGHHYGGPGNHFWKLLHMSGLVPIALSSNDDYRMPQYGIGFTNIVQRPSKAGSDITKDEIAVGAEVLMQKIKMYKPKIVAFNGRGIYEVYAGNKHFHYGKQPDLFPGTDSHVFVMPSSSARCSQLPRAEDKLPFYVGLRKLRDFVSGTLHSLNEAEITFPDIKIKDTDGVLQKTVIRISNKPFSELSADILKPYGDKIPSGQMVSKYISSPSSSPSSDLAFNPDILTTQTMSILQSTDFQPNENILEPDSQVQRTSFQNHRIYSPTPPSSPSITRQQRSLINSSNDNNSFPSTNTSVITTLAGSGTVISSQQIQPTQTIFIGGQQQSSPYALSSSGSTSHSSPISSYVVHHHLQSSCTELQNTAPRSIISSNHVSEHLPSFDTILSSSCSFSSPNSSLKDSKSSQSITTPKPTLIVVPSKIKSIASSLSSSYQMNSTLTNPSGIILPKISSINTNDKRTSTSNDESLYMFYERESAKINNDPYHFSYIIDEHSPSSHKRSRYVSINDL